MRRPTSAYHLAIQFFQFNTQHTMRLLHTMLRVGNLQRSIDFYTNVMGMKLLKTSENPEYKYLSLIHISEPTRPY